MPHLPPRFQTRRYALVENVEPARIAPYMPANYDALPACPDGCCTLVSGFDVAGWTLDDYVIPRLASGLHFARELTLTVGVS